MLGGVGLATTSISRCRANTSPTHNRRFPPRRWRDGEAELLEQPIELPGSLGGDVEATERGLIVGGLRPGIREANVLRLAPPLVIEEEDVERAVSILADALTAVRQARAGASRSGCRA
jgi:hypothetical protein